MTITKTELLLTGALKKLGESAIFQQQNITQRQWGSETVDFQIPLFRQSSGRYRRRVHLINQCYMGVATIKRELQKLSKSQLIDLVAELYKKNKSVKAYFDFYVNPNEGALFAKYRDKVLEAFYPKRGFTYSLKNGKQAISDFKKLCPSSELLAELMLFYVETGVKYTNDFGDINESFYKSLASAFANALALMQKEELLEGFQDRVEKIIGETDGLGWGFHDYLVQVWCDFYPGNEEV